MILNIEFETNLKYISNLKSEIYMEFGIQSDNESTGTNRAMFTAEEEERMKEVNDLKYLI